MAVTISSIRLKKTDPRNIVFFLFLFFLRNQKDWKHKEKQKIWLKGTQRISIALKHASHFLGEIAVIFDDRIEYYDPESNWNFVNFDERDALPQLSCEFEEMSDQLKDGADKFGYISDR